MKKFFIALTAICSTVSLFAQLPAVTGKSINKNTKVVEGWLVQGQEIDKKSVVINTNENGLVTSHVFAPVKDGFLFFSGKALTMQKGDSFELSCKVKGTGVVRLGYIAYSGTSKTLFSVRSKEFKLTGGVDTFQDSFEVTDGKDYPTATIRPFITVLANSKVELLEMKMVEE